MRRIRAAIHYQPKDAPLRLMADHAIAPMKREFKAALAQAGKTLDSKRAAYLIHAGRYHEAADAVDWHHYREVMKQPLGRIAALYMDAGAHGAKKINGSFNQRSVRVHFKKAVGQDFTIEKDIGDQFAFDRFDANTMASIRDYLDRFLGDLETWARATIADIVVRDLKAGLGPEDIVADLRDVVALNVRQANAVLNYRDYLQGLGTMDADQIETAVAQKAFAYLDQRAETIARTEATRAANVGLQESYRQAINRGVMPEEAVTKRWQLDLDERTCPICISIVDMNPDGVGINDSFDSSDGPIEAPPQHVGCRCSLEIVTNLDLVP